MTGQDPLALVRSPLPEGATNRFFFPSWAGSWPGGRGDFLQGNNLRLPASLGRNRRRCSFSTALFAAFHLPGPPVTQIVGGIVFAVAYHTGKSLMVPIVIHVLGNLAIFTLSTAVSRPHSKVKRYPPGFICLANCLTDGANHLIHNYSFDSSRPVFIDLSRVQCVYRFTGHAIRPRAEC
jgi:hypothetical protein